MNEPYVIFNGIKSSDIGLVAEKLPDFHRPARMVELIYIPGRDGRIVQDEGTEEAYTTDMRINCMGQPLSVIYSWLSGEGWMISSDEPDRAVWVSFHGQIKDSRFRAEGKCFDSLTVPVYCQPYRYHMPQPEDEKITSRSGQVTNPGTAACMPIITIKGTGDVSVMFGGVQMDFEGLTDGIIVDSELMDCFSLDRSRLLNSMAEMEDFPTMQPGVTYIQWMGDGSIDEIIVSRRCRDL